MHKCDTALLSDEPEANQIMAGNLKGKLLLAHGTLDNNVPPENTLLVVRVCIFLRGVTSWSLLFTTSIQVDALIKANKTFDLLMIPNAGHGFGDASGRHPTALCIVVLHTSAY